MQNLIHVGYQARAVAAIGTMQHAAEHRNMHPILVIGPAAAVGIADRAEIAAAVMIMDLEVVNFLTTPKAPETTGAT
jgi:hypothetical protein